MNDDDFQKRLAQLRRYFTDNVPHNRALGLEIVHLGPARARFRLPYHQKLVGNPERGILHGGAITTLIDAACGGAVFMALDKPLTIATLDLRIDYLRAAEPPRDVIASAECFRVTEQVAFVRAVAFHERESDPIAAAAGSFMLGTRSGRHPKEATA